MAKMGLANQLQELGEVAEARRLYEAVVEGCTQQLGAGHTYTLKAKMNLAILLQEQGEVADS